MRIVLSLLLAAILAACTTAPHSTPQHGNRQNQISRSLALCPGTHISNAPKIDSQRRIIGYDATAQILGKNLYRAPVAACVSSGFGPRQGGAGSMHRGVDLFTRGPAPIYAGGDGVIESIETMRGYGKTILIRHHHNLKTRYAHLSRYASGLRIGDRVTRGEHIGNTGKTGNATAVHLHYEILVHGRARNPLTVGK